MKPNCDQFTEFMINLLPEYKVVQIGDCGGSWDALPVQIEVRDLPPEADHITISPYVDPCGEPFKSGAGQKIYALEVSSATADSRGGCQTKYEKLAIAYGIVTCRLRNAGLRVINHYSEIF